MVRQKYKLQLLNDLINIKYLNVGWATFEFHVVPEIIEKGDICAGLTNFDSHTILIEDNPNEQVVRITILHEILHVLASTVGIRVNSEDCEAPLMTTNEFVVEQMARASLLFKALNPELFDLIFND